VRVKEEREVKETDRGRNKEVKGRRFELCKSPSIYSNLVDKV